MSPSDPSSGAPRSSKPTNPTNLPCTNNTDETGQDPSSDPSRPPGPASPGSPLSTHLDEEGHVRMVDVGPKPVSERTAVARAHVSMTNETRERLARGDTPKGDVLATAKIAGILAAKRTPELIPLCHAVQLTRVHIEMGIDTDGVSIEATAHATDRTGVEMEAMTAASVAALTLYDMLKGIDRSMRIEIELSKKTGGQRGDWKR